MKMTNWKESITKHHDYFAQIARESGPDEYLSGEGVRFTERWLDALEARDVMPIVRAYHELARALSEAQLHEATGWGLLKSALHAWLVEEIRRQGWPGPEATLALSESFACHFEGLSGEMSQPGRALARRWALLDGRGAASTEKVELQREAAEARWAGTMGWYMFPEILALWADGEVTPPLS